MNIKDYCLHNEYIYFYRANGLFGFLSNLYPCKLYYRGYTFKSSEHAYQFGKFADEKDAEWAMTAPKAHLVAAIAHSLPKFAVVRNWSDIKLKRMEHVLYAKFTQNLDLKKELCETYPARLVEESRTDAYWGIGKNGKGRNMLGFLLMKLRHNFLKKEKIEYPQVQISDKERLDRCYKCFFYESAETSTTTLSKWYCHKYKLYGFENKVYTCEDYLRRE